MLILICQKPQLYSSEDLVLNHCLHTNWPLWAFSKWLPSLDIPHHYILFTKDQKDYSQLMRFIWSLHFACVNLATRVNRALLKQSYWICDQMGSRPRDKVENYSLSWESDLSSLFSSLWPCSQGEEDNLFPFLLDAERDECVKREWLY